MKQLPLNTTTLNLIMRVVLQIIEDAEHLEWPARQAQLITDIGNVLGAFGIDTTMRTSWYYDKSRVNVSGYFAYWMKTNLEGATKPIALVADFTYYFYQDCSSAQHKKGLCEKFSKFYRSLINYLKNHG